MQKPNQTKTKNEIYQIRIFRRNNANRDAYQKSQAFFVNKMIRNNNFFLKKKAKNYIIIIIFKY